MKEINKLCFKCKKNYARIAPSGHKGFCFECHRKKNKEYYIKNKKRIIKEKINYLKKTNYKAEKNKSQRVIRCIKRKTRRLYPLINKNCEFCNKQATEHHHNTTPIEFDKFNYVCHDCHRQIDNREIRRIK